MVLWNSKESTPDLEDSSVIIDDVFYGSHNVVVDLNELGALDPARQEKYGETNWTDLTVSQLEAEIPTFKSIMSVNYDTSGSSDVEIKNKGKNLINLNTDFPSKWEDSDYCYTSDGYGIWRDDGVECYGYAPELGNNGRRIWSLPLWLKGGVTYTLSLYGEKLQPSENDRLFYSCSAEKLYTNDATGFSSPPSISQTIIKGVETNEGNLDYQFTPSESGWYSIYFMFYNSHGFIKNLQIEEGSEATDYEDPKTDKITIPSTVELHGFSGVANTIDRDGNYLKYWVSDDKTTNSSGEFTMSGYNSDSKVLCRNKDNGEVAIKDAADTVTTDWDDTDIEIIYMLNTPKYQIVPITANFRYLGKTHNNVIITEYKHDTFVADGETTVYDLSSTANNSGYTVKLSGKTLSSGLSKSTTQVTFDVAPRRSEIIEVFYNNNSYPASGEFELYELNGTTYELKFLTDITITENEEVTEAMPKQGHRQRYVTNKNYEIAISKDIIEGSEINLDNLKGKVFRIKIENTRDNRIEYLTPCRLTSGISKGWIDGSEDVTIWAGDYYDNS